MGKEIGKVTHWYNKIGVAVVKLTGTLKKGDKIIIKRGDEEIEETVTSIQVDYKDVDSAGKSKAAEIRGTSETCKRDLVE